MLRVGRPAHLTWQMASPVDARPRFPVGGGRPTGHPGRGGL